MTDLVDDELLTITYCNVTHGALTLSNIRLHFYRKKNNKKLIKRTYLLILPVLVINIQTSFNIKSLNGQFFSDCVLDDSIPETDESNDAKGAKGL